MTQSYDELRIGIAAIVSPLEMPYLQEWVDWHREIGFDDFYLVLNDWSAFDMVEFQRMFWRGCSNGWIHVYRIDGGNKQIEAYNNILRLALSDGVAEFGGIPTSDRHIDWLAFIDVDEFVRPRGKRSVKQVLNTFSDIANAVALNWRLYGSSGIEEVVNGDFSVLDRFKKCAKHLDKHLKQVLNIALLRKMRQITRLPVFAEPHTLVVFDPKTKGIELYPSITPDWTETHGAFNEVDLDRPKELELAHYITKSRRECQIRRSYRRADTGKPRDEGWEDFFNKYDINEIDDCEVIYEQLRETTSGDGEKGIIEQPKLEQHIEGDN